MTNWNYRVVKDVVDNEERYSIREVYYSDTEQTKIVGWSLEPEPPLAFEDDIEGESLLDQLRWTLDRMREALDKPVLTRKDLPNK